MTTFKIFLICAKILKQICKCNAYYVYKKNTDQKNVN